MSVSVSPSKTGIPRQPKELPVNAIAVLGTSIEGQTLDSTSLQYGADAKLVCANLMMGWPWSEIGDFGVAGDTSGPSGANPGMNSRVNSIVSGGYGWCFVGFPINDVDGGLDPDTFTIPNMRGIYDQLLGAGIRVIAGTGSPINALATAGNQARRDAYAKIQTAIRNYCEDNAGVILADTAMALTDPATGIPFTSPATTRDGVHDNYEGSMRGGLAVVNALSGLLKRQDTSIESPFDPRNYAINPFGQGDNASGTAGYTATTATGTGPNGWHGLVFRTGTAVGSRAAARADYWKQPQQGARFAITATATWDGALFRVGGSDSTGTGRFDQAWAATTAYTYGKRVTPTVANGYIYTLITPGTTGGSQPTWPTTEGSFTTDGTVVWMCQKMPAAGDQFYAEAEVETSGLTANKGGVVRLRLVARDTAGAAQNDVYCNAVDLSGVSGDPARYLPAKQRLRTPVFTLGSFSLRYIYVELLGVAEAGGSFNMDVFRVNIIRVT